MIKRRRPCVGDEDNDSENDHHPNQNNNFLTGVENQLQQTTTTDQSYSNGQLPAHTASDRRGANVAIANDDSTSTEDGAHIVALGVIAQLPALAGTFFFSPLFPFFAPPEKDLKKK